MADGQVLIDSKIDSSGVDKGTRKIEKEFEDLAKVARKTAEKMEKELRDIELGNVADGMSDSFDEESDRIKEILADTSADARTKAARIAAVYREAGDDQSDAMRKAWAIVKRESSVGSRAVVEDLDDISDKARSSSDEIMSMSKSLSSINFMATVEAIAEVAERVYEIGKTVIETVADVRAENAQFAQTFKDLEDQATESLTVIGNSTGITYTRMKKHYAGIYAFAKSVGADSAQAMEIADRAMLVAADTSAYYDRTLEDTTETLLSFIKGNYENDTALGIASTEMTRNAMANELYAKSFDKLTEPEKLDVLLSMVEAGNEASGAMGQAAREADSWTNVTGELQEAWRQLLAVVGTPVLDFVTPIVQDVTTALYDLKNMVSDFDISDIFGDVDFGPISESLSGLSESASELGTTIGEGLSWAWENVLQPLGEWSIEEGLPAVVEALASAFDLLRAAAEYLAPLALTLWNEFLQPIASWTADAAIAAFEGLSTGMDNLATAADTSSKTAADSIVDNFNTAAQTTDSGFIVPTHQEMQALYEDIGAGFAGASDDIINNFGVSKRFWT